MADHERRIEAIWRMEWAGLVAAMARLVGDVGRAEEIAQDAFIVALERWPDEGFPPNPGAWLMTTARHKAIDLLRRERSRDEKYIRLAAEATPAAGTGDPSGAGTADDDLLSLLFVACHPVLPQQSRVALTLRLVGGLTTDEIARAFLVPSPTIGQRISRAKRTLAEAGAVFEVPADNELPARLSAVLEIVYLIFNEGYSATSGQARVRRDLAEEAMRLGRRLTGLLPREPEVHGLVALLELQASRFGARFDAAGEPVLLADQDRSRWDRTLISHGLGALRRAKSLRGPLGPYTLQAAIAACHARAPRFEQTDWEAIVALYDALGQLAPSPVVALNRAVAVLHADGAEAALRALDAIADEPRLKRYHLAGAVRGDVLARLGRHGEAAETLRAAADLAPTREEHDLLVRRAGAERTRAELTG